MGKEHPRLIISSTHFIRWILLAGAGSDNKRHIKSHQRYLWLWNIRNNGKQNNQQNTTNNRRVPSPQSFYNSLHSLERLGWGRPWQNRPLDRIYPMVFLDAIHYHVRENNIVVKKAVYIALGYNLEGFKEILGMYPRGRPWVGENESSKYWLLVLNQLKERGLEDVLIFSTDNLPGFSEAIEAVYPRSEIQKYIIHQIRNSTKYVPYKDIKELMKDLKAIYKAPTEDLALTNLGIFE